MPSIELQLLRFAHTFEGNEMEHVGETSISDRLFEEQVALLYKHAPLAYTVTVINGAILAYVQSTHISAAVLAIWYGSLMLITVIRAVLAWEFVRVRPGPGRIRWWYRAFLIGAGVSGTVWGSAAYLLFPENSIAHQVFVAFVLSGMAAGGISVLAPRMEACLAFLLPEMLPLAVRYLSYSTTIQAAMGVMTLIFLVGMLVSAWSFHVAIRNALSLGFDKQVLKAEIVKHHSLQDGLAQEKDKLQTTLSSIGEGVVLIDAQSRIEYLNPAAEQLSGWSNQQAERQFVGEVFKCVDRQNHRVTTALEDSLQRGEQFSKQSVLYCRAGERRIVEEMATPLYDHNSTAIGAVSIFRDVTKAQQKVDELAYSADHDLLTGLPNRSLFQDRSNQTVARAKRHRQTFAMLFLDLDRFKEINDQLGHGSGDALLCEVANRLMKSVRLEDTVARLGGDEFVVLLDTPTDIEQAVAVADKILGILRKPYQLGTQTRTVSVSIGVSLYPSNGEDMETLLAQADAAMYRAKRRGRDQIAS